MTPVAEREVRGVRTQGPDLSKSTVLIRLETHAFGNSRKLKQSQYEVDGGDKSFTRASRRLLLSPELDDVIRIQSEARHYVRDQALPFPILSVYMVPLLKTENLSFQLNKFRERIDVAVDKFVEKYDERVEEARKANPKIFNPLDYPMKSRVRQEFDFTYDLITIGVPEQQLNRVNPEILEQSRKNCERLWKDAAEYTRQMQVEIMQKLVGSLRTSLEDDPSGKPKRLHAATVENLTDFLRQFESSMNVTDYAELETLVKQARGVLNGSTPDSLRDSAIQRDKVRVELKAIETKLKPMVGERKVRRGEEF